MKPLLYLGPEGTFSQHAAQQFVQPGETLVPCRSFRELFERLAQQPESIAVVPYENTEQGPVTEVMDLLAMDDQLAVTACQTLHISHHLASRDTTTALTRIFSHPQALGQCRDSLAKLYPRITLEPCDSTAQAAQLAAVDPTIGAVVSEAGAMRYHLTLRNTHLEDRPGNTTRFFRIEHRTANTTRPMPATPMYTLLHIVLADCPGALLSILQPFHAAGLNLTFIQSRPIRGEAWKYAFTLEVLIQSGAERLYTVLEAVRARARSVRILGQYHVDGTAPESSPDTVMTLQSIRAIIASLDEKLVHAFGERANFARNRELYTHDTPVSHEELAEVFAQPYSSGEQNAILRRFYIANVLPAITREGVDTNPRGALHADNVCLEALAQRFLFARHVIARKQVELADVLQKAVAAHDRDALEAVLLNRQVEAAVQDRAALQASHEGASAEQMAHLRQLYHDHILPVSRLIQIETVLPQKHE